MADKRLSVLLNAFGGVLIEGPKWCGKTTTALNQSKSTLMLMDPRNNFANHALAELDPGLAIEGETPRLIDEWQEVPKLWDAVRYECDARSMPNQFILTGSATPKDSHMPRHSGVGRIARMSMGTMSLLELGASSGAVSLAGLFAGERYRALGEISLTDLVRAIVRGGWPEVVEKSDDDAMRIAAQYIKAVAEVDINEVDGTRRDPLKVKRLIASLARNESTLATNNVLVKDMGGEGPEVASRQTVATYLQLLGRLHFTENVPAWNPAMRSPVKLRANPKRHLADPSLAVAALGASVASLLADPKTLGLLFESLVIHDLMIYAESIGAEVAHYHDTNDLEVDCLVVKPDGAWVAIGVKLGLGEIPAASRSLVKLKDTFAALGEREPEALCVIVGFGTPAYTTPDGIQVIPIDTLGV